MMEGWSLTDQLSENFNDDMTECQSFVAGILFDYKKDIHEIIIIKIL